MRARGLRALAVPRAADALRQAAAAPAVAAHRLRAGHRAAVLRASRRQDAHRHSHPRYAAQRRIVQLAALHVRRPVVAHGAHDWVPATTLRERRRKKREPKVEYWCEFYKLNFLALAQKALLPIFSDVCTGESLVSR